jgi:hypothetical protein
MGDVRAHVALLVDFASLRQQLAPGGDDDGFPGGRQIARSLMNFSSGVGRVGLARAYADWTREPDLARELSGTRISPVLVPATRDGEDRSHIRLAVDAMEALYNGDEPDAFVLVTSDPSLVPLIQALRTDGSEVIVVSADGSPDSELASEADRSVAFEAVLDGMVGEPWQPRPTAERSGRGSGGRGTKGKPREGRSGYYVGRPLLTTSNFESYDWTGFVSLIDELEERLPFVGVRYLVNKVLGPHNCGVDNPRIKRDLINEAVDEGLIELYAVGNVNDRTDPVTACRLDRHNEVVQEVLSAAEQEMDDFADDDLDADDRLDGDAGDRGDEMEASRAEADEAAPASARG